MLGSILKFYLIGRLSPLSHVFFTPGSLADGIFPSVSQRSPMPPSLSQDFLMGGPLSYLFDITALDLSYFPLSHPSGESGELKSLFCFGSSFSYDRPYSIFWLGFPGAPASVLDLHRYPSGSWLLREVFDMFGILFPCLPDRRRILTDYGFRGYPLLKSFPVSGYEEIFYEVKNEALSRRPIFLGRRPERIDHISGYPA